MHVISRKKLKEAAQGHAEREGPPRDVWFRIAKSATGKSIPDVRRTFSSADAVSKSTVFNLKGNQYRLIAEIHYLFGRVYIRHVLTHAEYERGGWKL
jgi:mRNA interferase HigB